jgi:hypothetical protein
LANWKGIAVKCEINLEWREGEEELPLARRKEPDEVWGSPLDGGWRGVLQTIDVLDATYADLRASLIAMLPNEMRSGVGVMVRMTEAQARDYAQGMDVSQESE